MELRFLFPNIIMLFQIGAKHSLCAGAQVWVGSEPEQEVNFAVKI
jgi:hypothetical protein